MPESSGAAFLNRHELSGAVADLGVLVPIAVALIVKNGLEPTAVLLPAALLYLLVGVVYRLPVPVQPLKAFGAIAIAEGLGASDIAAGALVIGALFIAGGATGLIDAGRRLFPRPLVRGVQLAVGLLLLTIGWELVADPPASFEHTLRVGLALPLACVVLVLLVALRRHAAALVAVGVGVAVALGFAGDDLAVGPSGVEPPSLDAATFWTALTVLVIPQAPLTFANSCLATADAARRYFGERARHVRPGRLALTLGGANLLAGTISGMPVCHGAGGMTAHYSFGARGAGAPLVMGVALGVLALALGAGLAVLLASFPLPILAALLAAAGLLHIGLLRDLAAHRDWALAIVVGVLGVLFNIAIGLAVGLVLWWAPRLARRVRRQWAAGRGGPTTTP